MIRVFLVAVALTNTASGDIACGTCGEWGTAVATCPPGLVIQGVLFASYGLPTGDCGSYSADLYCDAPNSEEVAVAACENGTSTCTIEANNGVFGDPW